jgi:ubiquinone/menaquinone biosynthesis C-methylase UbiE
MARTQKPYKGPAMEGRIASWYARNTKGDARFRGCADDIAASVAGGARVLEVAPGPGYLAIERARRGYRVSGLDISKSFVRIAGENAREAGVAVDFRHGNASQMPFGEESFDFVVCMAAFKNFTDPIGALDEAYRVLAPGGRAWIYDLRKEACPEEVHAEVKSMNLSRMNALWTRWTFRWFLLKNAYSQAGLERWWSRAGSAMAKKADGIGFELRLAKPISIASA